MRNLCARLCAARAPEVHCVASHARASKQRALINCLTSDVRVFVSTRIDDDDDFEAARRARARALRIARICLCVCVRVGGRGNYAGACKLAPRVASGAVGC